MADNNTNDNFLFGEPEEQHKIRQALEDMHYLLGRNYPLKASLALAGNRYNLVKRQLQALQGVSCSAEEIGKRKTKNCPIRC